MRFDTSDPENDQYDKCSQDTEEPHNIYLILGKDGEMVTLEALVSFIKVRDISILKPKTNTFHQRYTYSRSHVGLCFINPSHHGDEHVGRSLISTISEPFMWMGLKNPTYLFQHQQGFSEMSEELTLCTAVAIYRVDH